MPCEPDYLANIRMFENLNEDDRIALANVVDELKVPEGHMLFQAGDPGDSLFIVRVGQIELFIKDTVGQKIVLHAAQPGDMFGELAMLDSGPRTATALALMDSEVLVLDRDDLILPFQRKPEAALNMLASLSGLTRKADELLRIRVSRNVNEEMEVQSTLLQRIADWIAWFSGSMPFLMIKRRMVYHLDHHKHFCSWYCRLRSLSLWSSHNDCFTRGNILVLLRAHQSEPAGRKGSCALRHRI